MLIENKKKNKAFVLLEVSGGLVPGLPMPRPNTEASPIAQSAKTATVVAKTLILVGCKHNS